MDQSTQRVIGTAAILSVGVGTLNSFYKNKKPPSVRFLIGSGAAYVILSALAEAEPDVAKALSIAVATTVILGDGGGLLTYIDKHGETDTKNPHDADETDPLSSSAELYSSEAGPFTPDAHDSEFYEDGDVAIHSSVAAIRSPQFSLDIIQPFPGV